MADKELIGGVDVTGWSEEEKAALRAAVGELDAAKLELSTAAAAQEAARTSPAAIIEEHKRATEYTRRRTVAAAELEKARVKHGRDRVREVPIVDGRSIILRAMTLPETDGAEQRAAQLTSMQERLVVHRDALLCTVVFPPREEVSELIGVYPGLWGALYAARDSLILGVEEEHLGKVAASTSKPAAR